MRDAEVVTIEARRTGTPTMSGIVAGGAVIA
jgi:hypothetical protein